MVAKVAKYIMCNLNVRTHALINGVVKRCTSTWVYCCSVLRSRKSLTALFMMYDNEVKKLVTQPGQRT